MSRGILRAAARAVALVLPLVGGAVVSCSSFSESTPSVADASEVSEASIASDAPSDAAPAGFCAGKTNCDDFERETPVGGGWRAGEIFGGSSLAIDSTVSVSPTRSLRVAMKSAADNRASLDRNIDPGKQKVRLSFAMRVDSSHSAILAGIDCSSREAGATSTVFFSLNDQGNIAIVEAGAAGNLSAVTGPPPMNVFVRYAIELDIGSHTASLYIDGALVKTLGSLSNDFLEPKVAYVGNGFSPKQTVDGLVWFDDALLEYP
jgi:hypothetical protein